MLVRDPPPGGRMPTVPPTAVDPEPQVADLAAFTRLVHDAYQHLHDRAYLENHPLITLVGGASPTAPARLHQLLIDALEWLRPLGTVPPGSVEWRRYRHLQLRYLEGASTETIARTLLVSTRQARRDHVEALDEVARLLWQKIVRAGARTPRTPPDRPTEPAVGRGRAADPLEAELSSLAATPPAPTTRLAEVVAGSVLTVSRLAEAHGVTIRARVPPSHPAVAIHRTALRQLLLSLLSDLIVRHPGAAIEVALADAGDPLDLTIAVAGGAASEPFGLSPAVRELGARLAEGQGVTIRIAERPGGGCIHLALASASGLTILLVDDNPDMALLFRRYLAGTPHRLVQARSAERALRLARELQPDAIILDVLMPSHDGWEILDALHTDPTTAALPVIVCSVVPDHALAYSLGVADFLAKPVSRTAFLAALERLPARRAGAGPGPPGASGTPPRGEGPRAD